MGTKTNWVVVRGTLVRRLGEAGQTMNRMLEAGSHRDTSYQSGFYDALKEACELLREYEDLDAAWRRVSRDHDTLVAVQASLLEDRQYETLSAVAGQVNGWGVVIDVIEMTVGGSNGNFR